MTPTDASTEQCLGVLVKLEDFWMSGKEPPIQLLKTAERMGMDTNYMRKFYHDAYKANKRSEEEEE